jgi:hypothetical protein
MGEGRRPAATGAWICVEDEAGQNLRPPKARTWAPVATPLITAAHNQYRPQLIDAFLTQTGLTIEPP